VLNLDIAAGKVSSRVQGSSARPYRVQIEVAPLDDRAWDAVANAMAAQAIFAAKLLANEMPQNIEEAFAVAHVSLFPDKRGELVTGCSCPDPSNPCKHTAAVYYLLGERFDADPFLIFELRGRNKDQLSAMLRARRAGGPVDVSEQLAEAAPAEEPAAPLEAGLEHFWAGADEDAIAQLHFQIVAPLVDAAPVRRLGTPPFWPGKPPFDALMSHAYAAITHAALEIAFGKE
jgi:uncharacterized Zn finger protein